MEINKLRDIFHSIFNKINNIFTAVGANKVVLQEDMEGLSSGDLKQRINDLVEAMIMIEKNILLLNSELQEFYTALKVEKDLPASNPSSVKP